MSEEPEIAECGLDVLGQSGPDKVIQKEIEKVNLEKRSLIKTIVYDPKDEALKDHTGYTVTNHGNADIEAHVIYADKDSGDHDEIKIVKPNETAVFEHRPDAGRTLLQVLNKSFEELALFSAKGGEVILDFLHTVENIFSPGEKVKEIKDFHLSPRSYVVVLTQSNNEQHDDESHEDKNKSPENDEQHEDESKSNVEIEHGHGESYTVTNNGHEQFTVEVIHPAGSDSEETVILSEVVNAEEIKVIELDENVHASSLKIINYSYKEIAVVSATGGDVIHGYQHSVQSLSEPPQVCPQPPQVCPEPPQVDPELQICPEAHVDPELQICPEAHVDPELQVCPEAHLYPELQICPEAHVDPELQICPEAHVDPELQICPEAHVYPELQICPEAHVDPEVQICPEANVDPELQICPEAHVDPELQICPEAPQEEPKLQICPEAPQEEPKLQVCPEAPQVEPKLQICPEAPEVDPNVLVSPEEKPAEELKEEPKEE